MRITVRMLAMFQSGTGSCVEPACGPGAAPLPPDAATDWRGVLMRPQYRYIHALLFTA